MTIPDEYQRCISHHNGAKRTAIERFFFESTGVDVIAKVVVYDFRGNLGKRAASSLGFEDDGEVRAVFNLGSGDYDPATGCVLDDVSSDNGEVYKVFATVLGTVEQFYELYPTAVLFVQGSDSQAKYAADCLASCTRNCGTQCCKVDRRITTYRSFVSRNLETLTLDYAFYGLTANGELPEVFVRDREYKALLVYKRP